MSAADVAVGMMDGAYFTSRNELLTFFNTLLNLNLTKIEQTASGAVACQLTEYLFPGSIPMSKVNWAAKSSHEYVANYKLLQKAFTANKVQRYVDVDKLIRGKYQDNLEFCQWLKAFFDMQSHHASNREVYDAVAVRAKGKGGKTVPTNNRGGGSAPRAPSVRSSSNAISGRSVIAPVVGKARIGDTSSSSTAPTATTSPSRRVTSAARPTRERPAQKENHATNLPTTTATSSCKPTTTTVATTSSSIDEPALSSAAEVKKYQEKIKQLKSIQTQLEAKYSELQVLSTELEMNIANVESERDFYFEKLRGIEIMLQVCKEKEKLDGNSGSVSEMKKVFDNIFKVMYAAMEDNVVVDDEGNLIGDFSQDESLQNNISIDDLRPKAQDEILSSEEDDKFDELLTSGIVADPVGMVNVERSVNEVQIAQLSDDDDDDELLTADIISPVNNEDLLESVENVDVSANQQVLLESDDDDDDHELLTSGIDSADEAVEDNAADANRSAENARIISQLVGGNNNDDSSDEDLLAEDDASQYAC